MDQISPSHAWKFCPWCGTPRPKPEPVKTLSDVVLNELKRQGIDIEGILDYIVDHDELDKAVREHFKQEKHHD